MIVANITVWDGGDGLNVVVCLDDSGGMTLGDKRLSRDRVLIADLISTVGTNRLLMSQYSASLFEGYADANMVVDDGYLELAKSQDFCFVERESLLNYADKIEKILLYKWNRRYPATSFFDLPMEKWTVCDCSEFAGYSHEKITKEIYVK